MIKELEGKYEIDSNETWFIKKIKTSFCSDQIWGTLRVDQFTSFFLDNLVGKVKATLVSKKKKKKNSK